MLSESGRRFTFPSRFSSVSCQTIIFVTFHTITAETPDSTIHSLCISTNNEMSSNIDSARPSQRLVGLSAAFTTLGQELLAMEKESKPFGPSKDRYHSSPPPFLAHGIIRNSPAAIINTQPTYFSERSCATPMIPPSTSEFRNEMRDMQAHMVGFAHAGETHAQERHGKALKRAFQMRKDRMYRLSSPSNVIVAADPFHTPMQYVALRP